MQEFSNDRPLRKPPWLKTRVPGGKNFRFVKEIVEHHRLHTICSSGHCPNMEICWGASTATLMILGEICTRACKFCNVKTGRPLPVDPLEPQRVAESVSLMKLKHVVLTSVDRDDLPDGGAGIWAATIHAIKNQMPKTTIEALIPDFDGKKSLIMQVVNAGPEIISHNLETVRRITPLVRSRAQYDSSLGVLRHIAEAGVITKSGIMLGLGETTDEILETLVDMRHAGVSVVTIGQYLQPTRKHLSVKEYVHPDMFECYRKEGLKMGFRHVESAPLVRSSFKAEKHLH
ncbi:MAG: lipoyl synthase [Bacteroides sp.]|jgi:lipoic acid synthetase|nr:lipoyl synthase [Bacteroides sp.]